MPFVHGRGTEILLDGKDVSAWLRTADTNIEVALADVTTFKKTWKKFEPGIATATFESEGVADTAMTDIRLLLQGASPSVLSVAPGGATAFGDNVRLYSAAETKYKESAPVADIVSFNWAVQSDDTVGFGRSMHPLAAETATTTSTFLDGVAQSLNGAVAHLHITAVSGGSPTLVCKFQDATTSGGAYSDIAGGAFASANAVGAQRLVIPGTIRQFVKLVSTIGGSTPSFTYAVGFARK